MICWGISLVSFVLVNNTLNFHPISMLPDKKILEEIVKVKMPYGKFKGRILCDLPDFYLEYFKRNGGFPKGRLGVQMETVYEIKLNGLQEILDNLKKRFSIK